MTSHPAPSLSLPRPPAGQDGRARRAAGQRVPVHQRVRHEDHQRGHVVRGHSGWQPCCAHADNRRRALFPTLNTLPSNPLLCTSDSAGAAHRSPFITDLILPAGTAAAVTRLVTTAQKNRSLVLGQSQHNKQPSFPGMSAVLSIGDKGREKENVFPPADALPEIRPVGHLADPDEVVPSLGEERRADGRGGGQLSVCPSLTGRWQRYCGGWRGPPCRRVSPGFGSRSRQGDRRRWRTKVEAAPKAGLGSGGVDRRLI